MLMSERGPDMTLAVDGGGTACRFALDMPSGRVTIDSGPANVFSDFDGAIVTLTTGLEALAEKAGLPVGALHDVPAWIGLAGAVTPGICRRVSEALPLRYARIADDRVSALRGALGTRMGAVAHCGTGSFLALQDSDGVRLSGGWGSVLGDEASGYWVGRRALSLALDAADGLAQGALVEAIATSVGGVEDILACGAAAPVRVAALAPLVTAAADRGDGAAQAILRDGTGHLAARLVAMNWRPGMTLCLTGGFAHAYRRHLPGAMQDALAAPEGSPLDGAVALARDFAREAQP